jgi:hypothetical protein
LGEEGRAVSQSQRRRLNRWLIVLSVAALLGGLLLSQWDQVQIHAILL